VVGVYHLLALALVVHTHQEHKVTVQMVEHIPDFEVDKALVDVEWEVKPQVAEVELHKVQSVLKNSLVQEEMNQALQAFEHSAQRMRYSLDNRFHLEPQMLHNYGRYDTDYP
jgi:hypothetical protein